MGNVRIEINHDAVAKLLKSSELAALIGEKCAAIAEAAGAGGGEFGHDVIVGANRVHGMVWTEDEEARRAEATERRLTAALDAGRG